MSSQSCLVFLLLKVSFYDVIANKLIFELFELACLLCVLKIDLKEISLKRLAKFFKNLEQIKNNPGSFSAEN